jgi:hypothetical protein
LKHFSFFCSYQLFAPCHVSTLKCPERVLNAKKEKKEKEAKKKKRKKNPESQKSDDVTLERKTIRGRTNNAAAAAATVHKKSFYVSFQLRQEKRKRERTRERRK